MHGATIETLLLLILLLLLLLLLYTLKYNIIALWNFALSMDVDFWFPTELHRFGSVFR